MPLRVRLHLWLRTHYIWQSNTYGKDKRDYFLCSCGKEWFT